MSGYNLEKLPYTKTTKIDYTSFSWLEIDEIEVEDGIYLRVFSAPCQQKETNLNIVLVVGLTSHFLGWIDVVRELSKIGNVYHIETREKPSAIHLKKKANYSMTIFAKDLKKIVEFYNLDKKSFHLFGDSFGSEVVVRYLDIGGYAPKSLVLISPVETFAFSKWMKILFTYAPYLLFYPLLPFLVFVIKYFRTDIKNDKETFYLNRRNLITGNPKRMKNCALELFDYSSNVDYSKIKCNTYILAASQDKMHSYEESVKISGQISNVYFEDVIYYHKTHSREITKKIKTFILKND